MRLISVNRQPDESYWGRSSTNNDACVLKPGAFERLVAAGTLQLMQGETRQYEGDVPPEDIDGCFGVWDVPLDNFLV